MLVFFFDLGHFVSSVYPMAFCIRLLNRRQNALPYTLFFTLTIFTNSNGTEQYIKTCFCQFNMIFL